MGLKKQEVKIGRTMLLALLGFGALCIAGILDAVALFVCLRNPELADHVGPLITTGQVVVAALAGVTGGGALAHGGRHWGSGEPGSTFPETIEESPEG